MASWLLRRLRSDNGEGSARRAVDIMNPNDTVEIDSSNHIREGYEFLLIDASGKEVLCSVETEAAREEWVSKIRAAVDEIVEHGICQPILCAFCWRAKVLQNKRGRQRSQDRATRHTAMQVAQG